MGKARYSTQLVLDKTRRRIPSNFVLVIPSSLRSQVSSTNLVDDLPLHPTSTSLTHDDGRTCQRMSREITTMNGRRTFKSTSKKAIQCAWNRCARPPADHS